RWLEWAFLAAVVPLGLAGIVLGLRGPARLPTFLLGGAVLYFAALSGPEAYPRFRVRVMPALCLLAGSSLVALPWRRGSGETAGRTDDADSPRPPRLTGRAGPSTAAGSG